MNPKIKLSTMFIVVALAAIGTTATTAFAKETPPGIAEHADDNVHDNTGGLGSEQDFRFHEGLCQAGITTQALEEAVSGGCTALDPPGESGGVRQD